jgi:hypothetical protein
VFHVTACWEGVFRDSDSGVVRYDVWLGTSPHGQSLGVYHQRLIKFYYFVVGEEV